MYTEYVTQFERQSPDLLFVNQGNKKHEVSAKTMHVSAAKTMHESAAKTMYESVN